MLPLYAGRVLAHVQHKRGCKRFGVIRITVTQFIVNGLLFVLNLHARLTKFQQYVRLPANKLLTYQKWFKLNDVLVHHMSY